MSAAIRPSDKVSWSYIIMLSVMAVPHISQKGKKKKSYDYWKDSILIRSSPDKKE